ncbi:MAG: hypothetical protein M1396_06875 [Chloroflexi bacterium]|nr:hypothetical protein [Chloroflexota bacterium]MCL5946461.1 hypothetical protein [Chloroflexota bacterium]
MAAEDVYHMGQNDHRFLGVLENFLSVVEEGFSVPFSRFKLVNAITILEVADQLDIHVPDEFVQAQTIQEQLRTRVRDAQQQAEELRRNAREQAERRAQGHPIVENTRLQIREREAELEHQLNYQLTEAARDIQQRLEEIRALLTRHRDIAQGALDVLGRPVR